MSFGFGFGFPSQASATGGASLSLNFAGATSLDPKITFTRASIGSYYGSNGLLALSPVNLLTYSQAFDNAAWTKSNSYVQTNLLLYSEQFNNAAWAKGVGVTVTANSTVAPDGTLTADNVTFATGGSVDFLRTSPTMTVGVVYTMSVYALRVSGTPTFSFDIGNGGGGASTAQTPTTTWQRFTFTFTFAGANSWIDLEASGPGTIAFWGAQLVQGSSAGDYQATTTAAAAVQYASPTGSLTADKLVETTATGFHRIFSSTLSVSAGAAVGSIYAKAGERNQCYLEVRDGASTTTCQMVFDLVTLTTTTTIGSGTGTFIAVGGGWYRLSLSVTLASSGASGLFLAGSAVGSTPTYTGDGTSGIYLWGAQLQTGSTATTYIPTTATASGAPRFDYDPVTLQPKGLLIEEQRTNLLTYSSDFSSVWTFSSVSKTNNAAVSPDGGVNAIKCTPSTALTQKTAEFFQTGITTLGSPYTLTVFAKAAGYNRIVLWWANTGATNTFDLSTGTLIDSVSATGSIVSVGNGWYRCSSTYTQPSSNGDLVRFYIAQPGTTGAASWTIAADGVSGIYLWGAQLEAGAFATSYISSTNTFTSRASTATYYGSNGLIQTAATNVARYNYNPANLTVVPTLLLEAAATNLVTYSEDFTNAVWNKSNASVTANAAVSPDGTTNADKLVENTATSTHTVSVTLIAGSAVYTYSVYVKAAGRSVIRFRDSVNGVDGYFDLSTVSSPSGTAVNRTIVAVGGGWYRCSMTSSAAVTNPEFGVRLATAVGTENYTGDGVSGVFLYGSQVEAGSGATSYIPTVASQVTRAADLSSSAQTTRAADNAVMTGTNFSSWFNAAEGTFFNSGDFATTANAPAAYHVNDGTANNRYIQVNGNQFVTTVAGVNTANVSNAAVTAGTVYKNAAAYAVNNFGISTNGSAAVTTLSGALPTVNQLTFTSSGQLLNGHIRTITYWPRRLSNTELQGVTA